jgi:hypothetical protein
MTSEKRKAMLDIAMDILCNVHSDICNTVGIGNDIPEQSLELIQNIMMLKQRLAKEERKEQK